MDITQYQNAYNQALANSQQYQHQLSDFQGSMQDPLSFYNKATTDLNVAGTQNDMNTARSAVTKTNTLLDALPSTVQGQNQGRDVGQAQLMGLIGKAQQPLMQNYNTQNNNYSNLANQYQNLLQQAMGQANLGYQGQQQKFDTLNSTYQNAYNQQGQALQGLQFAQSYNQQQQALQAQIAQAAAQTNAIKQQMAITQAQIAAENAAIAKATGGTGIYSPGQQHSMSFLNGASANGKQWSPQDASALRTYSYQAPTTWGQLAKAGSPLDAITHTIGSLFSGNF